APPRQDARAVEARADILVYTGEPLTRALDILGDVRAVLPVRLVTVSVDLVVRLCDVDPAGVSRPVCDGVMRVRSDDDATVSLVPTGYRFLAGHRLLVHVARGAFPRYARDFGTTEAIADAHGLAPSRCVLPHEQRCPPHLVLPLFESNSP
ncbi:MAG TPA: CocE/NonD family hydrolase, partial [Pseudonocardiaceae bacterium]|nr:CocE/NonD family hydrolase [Pseudonocardiaceae bacterium]